MFAPLRGANIPKTLGFNHVYGLNYANRFLENVIKATESG
jgi:hypothetical protein